MKQHVEHEWPTRMKHETAYDFDRILDGSIWELVKGEDFTCGMKSLRTSIYRAARPRGLAVRMDETTDGNLILQAFPLPAG